jgi:hypothetical protein
MSRQPPQYAPLVYGIIQSAITTWVASAIAVAQLTGFGVRFLMEWLSAWWLAFLIMLPVVGFVSPLIQRCVVVLTSPPLTTGLSAINNPASVAERQPRRAREPMALRDIARDFRARG